ncbi:DctP family TRAP transporter solute-binding subunit [Pelagibius litoralis]|uniref:DctP family TRAP transporter solute-binding subunit n=1 Tax=Pelagibius litoralis TaxID=374515 RepID=A0A967F2N5_9PROT|nr:DctP family TRAP transporter solute-binding subunit [Pelagibius litoralis]NIA72071.1 DctP family TRAP transporter solute-binding subunit [Pelagibius litoralis]
MKRRTILKTLGLALAGMAVAGTAFAQEATLRFGHYAKPGDTAYLAAEHFKFTVENMTGGEVEISLHPAGELGNSPTMLEGARLGSIDLVLVGNPYFTAFAPQVNLLDLPFLFQSAEHAYAVMDGEVGDALMTSINQSNLQGLAFWEIGFRNLTNNVRAVSSPADLTGLKLRTTPNPAHLEAFQILGANPAPMPFSEVYSALQTGTIDGQENPVNHIYASKLHEVQKHLSLTAHAYTAAPLVANYGRFARLKPEYQQALRVAAKLSASYERALNAAKEEGSLQAMIDAGVEVVKEPDVSAFRDAVANQTRVAYVEKFGNELLQKVDALAK